MNEYFREGFEKIAKHKWNDEYGKHNNRDLEQLDRMGKKKEYKALLSQAKGYAKTNKEFSAKHKKTQRVAPRAVVTEARNRHSASKYDNSHPSYKKAKKDYEKTLATWTKKTKGKKILGDPSEHVIMKRHGVSARKNK